MFQMVLAAVGLVFVMEGILPFLFPKWWRQMMQQMIQQTDSILHAMGLMSMLIGLLLICVAHRM